MRTGTCWLQLRVVRLKAPPHRHGHREITNGDISNRRARLSPRLRLSRRYCHRTSLGPSSGRTRAQTRRCREGTRRRLLHGARHTRSRCSQRTCRTVRYDNPAGSGTHSGVWSAAGGVASQSPVVGTPSCYRSSVQPQQPRRDLQSTPVGGESSRHGAGGAPVARHPHPCVATRRLRTGRTGSCTSVGSLRAGDGAT